MFYFVTMPYRQAVLGNLSYALFIVVRYVFFLILVLLCCTISSFYVRLREKVEFFQGKVAALPWFYDCNQIFILFFPQALGRNKGRQFNGSKYCRLVEENMVAEVKESTTHVSEGAKIFSLMQLRESCSLLLTR